VKNKNRFGDRGFGGRIGAGLRNSFSICYSTTKEKKKSNYINTF